ncbi:MAG: serine/threonine-protein kinase, partial [Chthoniobacteraceae bacterium]
MPDAPPPDDTALGTQSAALEVGLRVFRQYVLKRFLSRGPLGSAWLVVHEGIGRELAMRFVPESWLLDERVVTRLRDAVVKMLEITHPGIVGVLDFARDAQAAAIVSKFIDGESALDAKAHQPQRCFETEKIAPWLTQVCEALDFGWRQHQATHGDLSPANLLVTPLGDVKVCDFGLARCLFDLESKAGGPLLALPPSHSSPARVRGEPATVADDVYAFGATVYDLLTSKPPFYRGNGDTAPLPRMAARRAELGIGGDLIPDTWEEVIAACLAAQPTDRPASVREAGERLGVIAPLPADSDRAPQPVVFPRPHETVGYRPPSTRPPGPTPEYSSSMATAAMEPPTISGT